MSSTSRSDSDDSSFEIDELLHIEARCRELRKEKDLLRETQSHSFDLIKRLELHVRRLNDARLEDRKQILDLQEALDDSHQEIDYLQDQLDARNQYVENLEEHVSQLQMKLANVDLLEEEIATLTEDLKKSNSECEFLMQELGTKETELQKSCLLIEKLEESISSAALENQCEVESMKLEMMVLEQRCFESTKNDEEFSQGTRLSELLHELELRLDDAQKNIRSLEDENKQARERLEAFEEEAKLFCRRVEEHFKGQLKNREAVNLLECSNSGNRSEGIAAGNEFASCGVILGPLLSKLLTIGTSDHDVKGDTETTLHQLRQYEELVKQLKGTLKEEKWRAKEEAEDLAQEMAELRYQLTELLEEERKRRACIEHASLQRISELESQLQMEQRKSVASVRGVC